MVKAIAVVIEPELFQCSRQVHGISEQYAIKIFTPNRTDQPLDERMQNWGVRNRLDLIDLK
jgi:hypothetical protein